MPGIPRGRQVKIIVWYHRCPTILWDPKNREFFRSLTRGPYEPLYDIVVDGVAAVAGIPKDLCPVAVKVSYCLFHKFSPGRIPVGKQYIHLTTETSGYLKTLYELLAFLTALASSLSTYSDPQGHSVSLTQSSI